MSTSPIIRRARPHDTGAAIAALHKLEQRIQLLLWLVERDALEHARDQIAGQQIQLVELG